MDQDMIERYRAHPLTQDEIKREYRQACRNIRQANKGLRFKVRIDGWSIRPNQYGLALEMMYSDGNNEYQHYRVQL